MANLLDILLFEMAQFVSEGTCAIPKAISDNGDTRQTSFFVVQCAEKAERNAKRIG